MAKMKPIHPGEVLLEDFLSPLGISQNLLARETRMSPRRINEITLGKRAITGDTAIRLGLFFGVEPEFWMNLQSRYDLESAQGEFESRRPKLSIRAGRYKAVAAASR
ncbi:MAG: HigA family addiction module antidote protein [Nitrospinae bacterium]|nr:HigA family addiction module antidote protein [Nitrospinota bacterium]